VSERDSQAGTLPTTVWVIGILAAAVAMLLLAIRLPGAVLSAAVTAITEGSMAALIFVAAGGLGYLLTRRLFKSEAPLGLCVVTAVLVGLWMLSTAVLLVGSLTHGLLTSRVWWPVIGAGLLLAAWRGRAVMEPWRWPASLDGKALVWILIALAAGLWLAGATLPPGFVSSFADEYDVLEYHLQLPRQYYLDQHVQPLPNTIYSHYPLGAEMLFLLCMCLRGGPYEGMYAAKLMHGAFGALAVAAVFLGLRRQEDARARFSAALLATTPLVVYLGWLAMVELAQVAYLVVALLWLRRWMRSASVGAAAAAGAMLGGACAVKYLSVGFVFGPVAVVMLAWPLVARRAKLLAHAAVALLVAIALFSPHLGRNFIDTGNPVFPLASEFFDRPGSWPAECQQRWIDGHGPQLKPPVPKPADYRTPLVPTHLELFYHNFVLSQWFGPLSKLLAVLAVCVLLASTQWTDPWDWALVAVLAMQLVVWAAATHGMPPRFAVPTVVPIALLGGGLLARLGQVQTNPFRKDAPRPSFGPWGMVPAVAALFAAAAINLLVCYGIYCQAGSPALNGFKGSRPLPVHGVTGRDVATQALPWRQAHQLPAGSRILLVGDAKAFYFPHRTAYATVFNAQPLDEMVRQGLSPAAILERLRKDGITHLWFDWFEIHRLARTYGFPASLSAELLQRDRDDQRPSLPIVRDLEALGMTAVGQIEPSPLTTAPATAPTSVPATGPTSAATSTPASGPASGPLITIYALPDLSQAGATSEASAPP
jgi:hypothetical protein